MSASTDVESSVSARLAAIERWLLRAGTFALPLAFWPLTFDHYVLPKLLVARFLVLGLAVLFVARSATEGRLVWKRTALDFPLVALIASAVAGRIDVCLNAVTIPL